MLSGPASGCFPSAIGLLSSVIAQVTELSMRGSGRPPGPVGFWTTSAAAAPVGPAASAPVGVVVFSQPATRPAVARPAAAPADRWINWRRFMPEDRSFGCFTYDPLFAAERDGQRWYRRTIRRYCGWNPEGFLAPTQASAST